VIDHLDEQLVVILAPLRGHALDPPADASPAARQQLEEDLHALEALTK
jgi:hypothetical protein